MMDRALSGLRFAYCYLDDLRIASPDLQSHKQHLAAVFERLRDFGLVMNREKCVFAVSSFEFLGHLVSAQGARPLLSYVEAVEHRPRPATIKELQIFLGLINLYRRFIPGAASVLKPLTDTLRGSTSGQQPLVWTADMEASFEAAKQALSRLRGWAIQTPPQLLLCTWMPQLATWVLPSTSVAEAALPGNLWGFSPKS